MSPVNWAELGWGGQVTEISAKHRIIQGLSVCMRMRS